MISRKGPRRSGAAAGAAKILREEGNGPVVTAGRVVSGLERIFMASSFYFSLFRTVRGSGPIRKLEICGARFRVPELGFTRVRQICLSKSATADLDAPE